ncbi:AraC family transcriptional regulator [Undibacterium cyanobacteriorum]|uniref:AraC family transcriptional regulator n=1 Tax=Undibacterium cyanobacteriorum TaxID=3073561 RepID=A0ABY9RDS2_9BURK|nr:AraC family transcriptional regulator [Undibacterium sp. 20NA77.5]WMW79353.1 AraC family transcriptional regulator [Undibacterium sp. 20NA77.5]
MLDMIFSAKINETTDTAGSTRLHLAGAIDNVFFAEPLFDAMPDVVFFVKDLDGRYVVVNQTLVNRCGFKDKYELVGRTVGEVFPASLAATFEQQDQLVLSAGQEVRDQLELHLYPDRDPGWCLTNKIPLRDAQQRIIGLTGTSRDLGMPDQRHPVYHRIAAAVRHIHTHYAENVHMAELEKITGLSVAQIERYFQKIFSLTPRQFMTKVKLDAATNLLEDHSRSITDIAMSCGYQDHSAFTRMFKATVGVTPSEYREVLLRRQSRAH